MDEARLEKLLQIQKERQGLLNEACDRHGLGQVEPPPNNPPFKNALTFDSLHLVVCQVSLCSSIWWCVW